MNRSWMFVFCILWSTPTFADDVRMVQQKLLDKGYPVGKVDGKFGRQTAGAIQRYQTDWQIPVTGKITSELVARLNREHTDTKARMQKADNADCQIWNSYPRAREKITFKTCDSGGPVNGNGEVVWRWLEKGDWQTASYTGGFSAGKLNGSGVLNYPDGHRYEGEFSNDMRHGEGIQEWARGSSYEGQWQDGRPHGKGTYVKGEERYAGTWRQGCFSEGKRMAWIDTNKKACGFK